jgi:hypothetical protein
VIGKERKPSGKSQKSRGPVDMTLSPEQRGRKRATPGKGTKSQGKRISGISDRTRYPKRVKEARVAEKKMHKGRGKRRA